MLYQFIKPLETRLVYENNGLSKRSPCNECLIKNVTLRVDY